MVFVVWALGVPSSASAATCADFPNQAAAQFAGNTRDGDGDGIYCEALPCPCSTAPPGTSPPTAAPPAVVPPATTVPAPGAAPAPVEPEPVSAEGSQATVRVLGVTDGDTIKVRLRDGRRRAVRLIGIDTPETVKPRVPEECGGRSASAAMRSLVMKRGRGRPVGRIATLISDTSQGRTDRFGRLLAYVQVDGRDVGRSLVRSGWAAVYVYARPFSRLSAYETAADAAKGERRGVWGACDGDFHSAQ
jgi:micrococcal nuclease